MFFNTKVCVNDILVVNSLTTNLSDMCCAAHLRGIGGGERILSYSGYFGYPGYPPCFCIEG